MGVDIVNEYFSFICNVTLQRIYLYFTLCSFFSRQKKRKKTESKNMPKMLLILSDGIQGLLFSFWILLYFPYFLKERNTEVFAFTIGLPWWLSGWRIHLPMRKIQVWSLDSESRSSILGWEIAWTEEPVAGSPRGHRVRYNMRSWVRTHLHSHGMYLSSWEPFLLSPMCLLFFRLLQVLICKDF